MYVCEKDNIWLFDRPAMTISDFLRLSDTILFLNFQSRTQKFIFYFQNYKFNITIKIIIMMIIQSNTTQDLCQWHHRQDSLKKPRRHGGQSPDRLIIYTDSQTQINEAKPKGQMYDFELMAMLQATSLGTYHLITTYEFSNHLCHWQWHGRQNRGGYII